MNIRVALNAVLATTLLLGGCTSPGQRLDQRAREAGLEVVHIEAGAFPSIVYLKRSAAADHANDTAASGRYYLESDGIPGSAGRRATIRRRVSRWRWKC